MFCVSGTMERQEERTARSVLFTSQTHSHQDPTSPARHIPRRNEAPDAPLRILLVEDNYDVANTLRDLLELMGFEVRAAYTGFEGVDAALEFLPDVILCDIGLPGLDGYEVAATLRQEPATATARMIAITGYGSEESRSRSRAAGFEEHLTKPLNMRRLEELLGYGRDGMS